MAVFRKNYLLAVLGAVVSTIPFFYVFTYDLVLDEVYGVFLILGIESLVGLVLILVSRGQFEGKGFGLSLASRKSP